jgi:phosphoribosylaminoimidazole-succinocarboxamide synthase
MIETQLHKDSALHKIASGSVKDIYTELDSDSLHFVFSDRVSVFDYGAIPEKIPHRGEALATFAQYIFHSISTPSTFLGASELGTAALKMKKVSHPKFHLHSETLDFVPLEVIFRWGVPEGSKLIQKGYQVFEKFQEPKIQFTTKLEAFDRDLTTEEVSAFLPEGLQLTELNNFAQNCALELKNFFESCGLTLWDGKIEVAFHKTESQLYLIDAITPDELRLSCPEFPHIPLSKELLRRWYHKTLWPFELQKLKKDKGQNWKQNVPPPPHLGEWRVQQFSQLFVKLCEVVEKRNSAPLLDWIQNEEKKPRVFIAGKGGRETALRWRLEQEGCEIAYETREGSQTADAVLISNDSDLAKGLVNELTQKQTWVVGPQKEAAHIEWSKLFGKRIAEAAKIPIARWTSNPEEARKKLELPVIKQDGLAAGKGVVVPESLQEFDETVSKWSSHPLLFEERLRGEEASVFFWIHPQGEGFKVEFLGAAQDFKRRFEKNKGPNTGGMGAKSPHPSLKEKDIQKFKSWAEQTAFALKKEGILYSGVLFMGLLNDVKSGWMLLEYNARFGDPETQALVHLWKNPQLLRSHLGLSLTEYPHAEIEETKVICLALVHPQYPKPAEALELPEWTLENKIEKNKATLFKSGSLSGRVAYLCLKDKENPGKLAQYLIQTSPWSEILEWRKDILE